MSDQTNPQNQCLKNIPGAAVIEPVKKVRLTEKWKNFWVGVKTDYSEAVLDFYKDAAAKPLKSTVLGLKTLNF